MNTPREAAEISTDLGEVGFNLQLLGYEEYFCSALHRLNSEQLSRVKGVLAKNDNPRLRKELGYRHRPFGNTAAYVVAVQAPDPARLAKII